jgi:hypothetical protein
MQNTKTITQHHTNTKNLRKLPCKYGGLVITINTSSMALSFLTSIALTTLISPWHVASSLTFSATD